MNQNNSYFPFAKMLTRLPTAIALIRGSRDHPSVSGTVKLYQTPYGVLTVAEITGLPSTHTPCSAPIFAWHIHEGSACTGTSDDPFANAGMHFDPQACPHPYHAGDLPPLFSTQSGLAFVTVLIDRFTVEEVIGKTVIIHATPDDFSTQPSGNAGTKIACGEIVRTKRIR